MDTKILIRPSWVEINLDVIMNNIREIQRILPKDILLIGTLKANAYGHGIVPVAKTLVKAGVPMLAVGNLYEAIMLRKAGITVPIQVFYSYLPDSAHIFVDYELMPTFAVADDPKKFKKVLKNIPLRIWLKVETGLGRLGIFPEDVPNIVKYIYDKTSFIVEGIYSHIGGRAQPANPADQDYCEQQWKCFEEMKMALETLGYQIPYYQLASSYSMIGMPQTWYNCVSIANSLYSSDGPQLPRVAVKTGDAYQAIRSKLISINKFSGGRQIGGHLLQRDSLVGVAPIGLGDGLHWQNRDHGVLVNGVRVPIIGPVSYEYVRIDVTDVPDVAIGDIVTIMGKDGTEEITVEDMLTRTNVTKHQFWTSIHPSTVPYIYFKGGKMVNIDIHAQTGHEIFVKKN